MIIEFPRMYIKGASAGNNIAEVVSLEEALIKRERERIYRAAIQELEELTAQMEQWLD